MKEQDISLEIIVEWSNGTKVWYLNNKLHREDGPAVEYADGDKQWYLNGEYLTEDEFNRMKKNKKTSPYFLGGCV